MGHACIIPTFRRPERPILGLLCYLLQNFDEVEKAEKAQKWAFSVAVRG